MERHKTLIVQLWLEPGAGARASVRSTDMSEATYFKNLIDLNSFLIGLGIKLEEANPEVPPEQQHGLR